MQYSQFFETCDRLASKKSIALVKGALLPAFIEAVVSDKAMDNEFRALVLISLSGGLRISEALALTRENFEKQENCLYLRAKVLKRRKNEQRWARIHPQASDFVENYIRDKVGAVVKLSQPTAYRRMQRHFQVEGVCNHSLRHSNISYLLFEQNMTHIKAAKLLHVHTKTIEHYAHLDERRALKQLWG